MSTKSNIMLNYFSLFFFCFISQFIHSQHIKIADSIASNSPDYYVNILKKFDTNPQAEKLLAAEFIVENIPIHYGLDIFYKDNLGEEISFNELDYNSYDDAKNALEKLKSTKSLNGEIHRLYDSKYISAKELFENINRAYRQWKNNPWSSTYDFDTFCEFILPYRSTFEPFVEWRSHFEFLYSISIQQNLQTTDPVDVVSHIYNELKDFTFSNTSKEIPFLSSSQIKFQKDISCQDLANLAVFAMRSAGLAITFDFTPHYGASSNRHYWNTVVDQEGNHIPFCLNYQANGIPYAYDPTEKRLAKVFRFSYSRQKNTLSDLVLEKQIASDIFKLKNLIDVTSEYVNTVTVHWKLKPTLNTRIGYLNVFNLGRWRIIDWGKKVNNTIFFENMGINIVYLPSAMVKNKMVYAHHPILIDKSGKQYVLKADEEERINLRISRSDVINNDSKDFNTLEIENNKLYHLYYWKGAWIKVGTKKATNDEIVFKEIPKNALLLLRPNEADNFERIFVIDSKVNNILWF